MNLQDNWVLCLRIFSTKLMVVKTSGKACNAGCLFLLDPLLICFESDSLPKVLIHARDRRLATVCVCVYVQLYLYIYQPLICIYI